MPKFIANNPKARFEYFILEKYTAGLVLFGSEVKSIKLGKVNIKNTYVKIINKEAYILGMHVSRYPMLGKDIDETRTRKLLLNKKELVKLAVALEKKGLTVVPLSIMLTKGLVKLEIATAKGKKSHDKRESIKLRDLEREELDF